MKMTIARKINSLIYGLLGLLLVTGIFGMFGLHRLANNTDAIKEEMHIIDEIQELRVSFLRLLMPAHDYVITGNMEDKEQLEQCLKETKKYIAKCKSSLLAHSYYIKNGDVKEKDLRLLDSISGEIETISVLSQEIFKLPLAERMQAERLLNKLDAIGYHVSSELSILIDDAHEDATLAEGTVDLIKVQTRNLYMATLVVSILGSLIAGLVIANPITKAICQLSFGTEKVAQGDYNYQVHVQTNDELATLGTTFNEMTNSIRSKNENLEIMNEGLRSANEELETTNEELRSTTEELEASNEELRSTTEELEVSNEELRVTNEELAQAHEKLLHQKKLAAVGQLASGIGHELRNPLGVVKNATYYIKTKIGNSDEKLLKHLNIMEREINNSNKIINDLLGFSRTRMPSTIVEDVNKVVEQSLEVVQVPKNVLLVTDTDDNRPKIKVDKDQIQQVLVNLCMNGIQAMGDEGGQLQVSTHLLDDFVYIKVADTGYGIPEENLSKLFDPFFTTKAKGIGLGLAVSYGIIEKHGGGIEVQSEAGQGATFIVKLPAVIKETMQQYNEKAVIVQDS